ncbi:alkane hydroxylase MAH1-like [Malania oleifera]|uniref:alkane hydroxylase MAH1-like n=1 Tax=Malania oleifera TaxID=397392 RepID=UPI0025ADE6A4|nr:alkane hydroxylase MAH1-like [Malania oleifera]
MLPMLLSNTNRIHEKYTEILEQSKGTFMIKGAWFSKMKMLTTSDPANVQYIMSMNFSNYSKGSEFKKVFDVLGDGLFNCDFEDWRSQRKHASAFFNHQQFHFFTRRIVQDGVDKGLVPVLEHVSRQGIVVDLQDLFQRLMFDATCILATGQYPGSLCTDFPEAPFSKAMDEACETIFSRHFMPESFWKLQKWLGIGKEKKLSEAWEILDHIIGDYISRRRDELNNTRTKSSKNEVSFDALKCYLTEPDVLGPTPSDALLRDNLLGLMLAGRDTTSAALAWFFWLISRHPLVQTKIREELKANLPAKEAETWRLFKIEELSKLVYLHGALCETLRLFPPVPLQRRTPVRADTLPSGHHISPDTMVVISTYAMGRMPSVWGKDCQEFKPERWISEMGGNKHEPPHKFFAFNAGPRTCLGKMLAFTEMKAVAAAIIHNYNLQVVEGHPVKPAASIVLHMKHGLKARITKRWA